MSRTRGDHVCLVCGFDGLDQEPVTLQSGGSYEICPSCGFQFGNDDFDGPHTYGQWREMWVSGGMAWWAPNDEQKAAGWDPQAQLARLLDGAAQQENRFT